MPYIVTTLSPAADGKKGIGSQDISRRAVATLEEAWRICDDAFAACPGYAENFTLLVPSESGGTVGPLPDGTVIEVESVEWSALHAAVEMDGSSKRREVIDAFNAREAER